MHNSFIDYTEIWSFISFTCFQYVIILCGIVLLLHIFIVYSKIFLYIQVKSKTLHSVENSVENVNNFDLLTLFNEIVKLFSLLNRFDIDKEYIRYDKDMNTVFRLYGFYAALRYRRPL